MSSVLGDVPVVLVFAPAALTGGCTTEMCTFRDSIADFDEVNARVYSVSVDPLYAHNVQVSATWICEDGEL
jgi:peroxiredoxin